LRSPLIIWNEERKNIQKGREILVDVKENIVFNTTLFQTDIKLTIGMRIKNKLLNQEIILKK
jgi:hypothetical protein